MVTVFLSPCCMQPNSPFRYAEHLFPGSGTLFSRSECKTFVCPQKAAFITSLCAWRVTAGAGLAPATINRVAKELRDLQLKPEEGIRVSLQICLSGLRIDKTCTWVLQ